MAYGKTAYIDSQGNFCLIDRKKAFYLCLGKIKPYLILMILFAAVFALISADFGNLKYAIWSRFSGASVRKMNIPQEWIQKYNVVLTDKMSVLDDKDGDGLTFQDEALYGTNPFDADTDSDGTNDSEEVKQGTNPLGSGELDSDRDGMPDKWEKQFELSEKNGDADLDSDSDGLNNIDEYLHGTDPNKADTDGDGYNDREEIINGFDPAAPGNARMKVIILAEKINLIAPMVWSETEEEADLQKDLENGVARYPKTGAPGQFGNMVIAGHSSNYAWAKGNYNFIFRNLNKLQSGDKIIVRTIQQNGKTFEYEYKVTEKKVVLPDDEWSFENPEGTKRLTLSTCWPLGTDVSRLIIRAEMEE